VAVPFDDDTVGVGDRHGAEGGVGERDEPGGTLAVQQRHRQPRVRRVLGRAAGGTLLVVHRSPRNQRWNAVGAGGLVDLSDLVHVSAAVVELADEHPGLRPGTHGRGMPLPPAVAAVADVVGVDAVHEPQRNERCDMKPTIGKIVIYRSKIDNGPRNNVQSPAMVIRTRDTTVAEVVGRWGPEPRTVTSADDPTVTHETAPRPDAMPRSLS
jgi:hypothetical protein